MEKKPAVVLTGPTAVGKTNLSIKLAKEIGADIISADSIQVYKYMDIGSAKVTEEEMCGVKHHLIDCLDPSDEFNVSVFKDMAVSCANEIYERGRLPLIVGGTGFYVQAFLKDVNFEEEPVDDSYRRELEKLASEKGADILNEMLKKVDSASASLIHKNNIKRTIRALEFYKMHGYPISEHNEREKESVSPYNYAYFVLNDKRDILYERINKRVDIMIEAGLVEEVKKLIEMGYDRSLVSMQGIGYKEICAYLFDELSLDGAIDLIKKESRHFAKRQLTWFRREKDVIWVNKDEFDYSEELILEFMKETMRQKGIIK
ncbi:MAG: tRNA (adenosine(37)-N6)-dimethylallyltransferase MiaA [Lachnospiraceae bacterium]|nr:tRNA (adenosine(37)-N6)-dimethylallyltransferase MiaA [Lachnospiraceae bacterium]